MTVTPSKASPISPACQVSLPAARHVATADSVTRAPLGRAHRWKVLAVGVAANASFIAAANGFPSTAVWLRGAYGLDNAGLGLLLGALGLGVAAAELPWGMAADRWVDRRVLLAGLGVSTLVLLAMAMWVAPSPAHTPGLHAVMLWLALLGLAGGSVNGASGRAVMRWFEEGERGLAMSIRQTAVPLGGALGALALPPLAQGGGFQAVYAVLATGCLLSTVLTWRWLVEAPEAPDAASAFMRADKPEASNPLASMSVWRMALGIGLLCAPQFAILSFGSVFLHDRAHAGWREISLTLCVIQLGAMVLRIWSGRHTDRTGNRPGWLRACTAWSALAFLPLAACAAVMPSQGWTVMAMAAVALAGIAVSAWHGVAYTELASRAGAQRAGTALGLANTLVFLSYFLTPLVLPYGLGLFGWSGAWALAGVCAAFAMPLFRREAKHL